MPPRRRRPSHRAHLAHLFRPWQPLRPESSLPVVELEAEDAFLDDEGGVTLSLRGLLKALVASRPEAVKDGSARARIARLRERATSLRAAWTVAAGPALERPDLGDLLIAGLGGEALRSAHDAGEVVFFKRLDHELAARLQ